ncbi:MAG: M15 family metallopeptidase [Bacteroidota bacterium]
MTLLLKNFFKICLTCITLWACSLIDQTSKLFGSDANWKDFACDTTQTIKELSIQEIAQNFYLSDTLLEQNLSPQKVFVAIADQEGLFKIAGVTAQGEERPQALILPDTLALKNALPITWQEQEYLWALANQPRYLYNRWEKLLAEERTIFLAKRDSIHTVMKNLSGSVKIISDLRSMANQQKYLKKNKTASPISMHNFGFAADFAILRRNRISNNLSLYQPLNNLTAQQGMTWGGNFVGFMDPGHIQLFRNGAELLRKYPDLIFEFEPYRPQYNAWMNKMIALGKEEKANDTKELLLELNKFKKEKPCSCLAQNIKTPTTIIAKIQKQTQNIGYQSQTDLLIVSDLASQTVSLVTVNGIITYSLGKWQ